MSLEINSRHLALPMVGNSSFYSQADKISYYSDIQFNDYLPAGSYYWQFFRARTSGEFLVNNISWEGTAIQRTDYGKTYSDGELDSLFHNVASNEVPLLDIPSYYIVKGAVIAIQYYKAIPSSFRLQIVGYYRANGTEITGITYNYANLRSAVAERNEFGTHDILASEGNFCNYASQQEGDYIRYKLSPDAYPSIEIRNNSRLNNPELQITSEYAARTAFGINSEFSVDTAEYDSWTSISNGLRAFGFFVNGYDLFELKDEESSEEEQELHVIRVDGSGSYHSVGSTITKYDAGVTSSYWRYYEDKLLSYCSQRITDANANGAHYNSLVLITSKSSTVGNSVWKIIIQSSTSGENDIVINNIAFSTLRYLFEESSTHDDYIILKGTGFSYTHSTSFLYSGRFDSAAWGGSSLPAEVRVKDAATAIEKYGIGVSFTIETEDYAEWTEIDNGGLEVRGFFVRDYNCYMLLGPSEWIEYPDLDIKIKASQADTNYIDTSKLEVDYEGAIPNLTSFAKEVYNGNQPSGTYTKRFQAADSFDLAHGSTATNDFRWSGFPDAGNYTGRGQVYSINSSISQLITKGTILSFSFALERGKTFNVLGRRSWHYYRNGDDISSEIYFDAETFFANYLYANKGLYTIYWAVTGFGLGSLVGRGLPYDWSVEYGDYMEIDIDYRSAPVIGVTYAESYSYYAVRLGELASRERMFTTKYGDAGYYPIKDPAYYPEGGYIGNTNTSGFRYSFDYASFIATHKDDADFFPLTIKQRSFEEIAEGTGTYKETLSTRREYGTFTGELGSLCTFTGNRPIYKGDKIVVTIYRDYFYGANILFPYSSYVEEFTSWNRDGINYSIEVIGEVAGGVDACLIAPLNSEEEPGGGDDPGNEDIPTPVDYCTVTFDAETNGGTCYIYQYKRRKGTKIGALPVATKVAHVMTGWFKSRVAGEEITPSYIVNGDMTVYAQFSENFALQVRHKRMFPYHGSGLMHDVLMQTRPKELDPALGNTFRVVVRGYFRNPQENGSDKHLGLYVLGSYDYKNWQLYGWKEKRLSDAGFHDIGCETYRASMKYIMVILTGQLADGSHIDKIDMTGIGRYNNKLK